MKKSYVIYGKPSKGYKNHCHSRGEETEEKGSGSLFLKNYSGLSKHRERSGQSSHEGKRVFIILIKNGLIKIHYNKILKVKYKERIFKAEVGRSLKPAKEPPLD